MDMSKEFSLYTSLIFVGLIISISGCKKEDPAKLPIVSTTPATNITVTTATSGGLITSDGGATIIANGVCWSTNLNPSLNDSKTVEAIANGQYVSNLTGLTGGTTYHVRAYATNAIGTAYGSDMSFATLGLAPVGLTQTASNVSATEATLTGTVNPNYLSTNVTFEFGTTINYGQTATANQSPITGNSIVTVSVTITGLTPGITYHFRIKTVNSLGTAYGDDMTFTTSGYAPAAVTQPACCLSATGATLNGIVNANYLSTIVTFEYGSTTSYGNSVTASQSSLTGNTNTNVSATISGLTPGATYHFRVKAVNSLGTTYGGDLSFETVTQTYGLYTIKTGTDELYFIDLSTNNFTKVANIGVTVPDMFSALQYKDGKLYISFGGKLYTFDLPTKSLKLVLSNSNLAWQFSINSLNELYTVNELSGPPEGSLYKINIATNTATKVGTTTGTMSIWGLGFDNSGLLWTVDEFYQRYGVMNTTTGRATLTSATIPFTDTYYSTPDNNGNLYSFNVGIPTGVVRYNISSNTASLLIPLSVNWAGLAYGPY